MSRHNRRVSDNIYYHGTLLKTAPLIVRESKGSKRVTIEVAGKPFPLVLKKKMEAVIEAMTPSEGEIDVLFWPRTDKEGLLGSVT